MITPICAAVMENEQTGSFYWSYSTQWHKLYNFTHHTYILRFAKSTRLYKKSRVQCREPGSQGMLWALDLPCWECSELWTFHAGNALSSEPSMLGMLWTFRAGMLWALNLLCWECSELWTFYAGNALSSEPSMLGMLWTFHAGKALSSIKGLILSCKTHTDNVSTQCAHNMSLSPRKIGGQLVERVARICGEDPPIIVWAGPIRLPVS